jgi:hypothetical protein
MRLKWKRDSVRLEIVLSLTQDGCTVSVKRTTGSDIILDAHVESRFGPFGDSVSVSAR